MKQAKVSSANKNLTDLHPLFEFSKIVNSSLDVKFVLGTVLLTMMGKLLLSKGVVLLKSKGKIFRIENVKGLPQTMLKEEIIFQRVPRRSFSIAAKEKHHALPRLSEIGITRFFPIVSHDEVIGFFGIAERAERKLTADDKNFVEALINISAAAVEKGISFEEIKSVNRTLDGKIQQLKTLFELSKEFSAVLERKKLLKFFTLTLMGQVGVNRYAICLRDGETISSRVHTQTIDAHKNLVFTSINQPVLAAELPKKKIFQKLLSDCVQENIEAFIPLQVQNEVQGMLCLGKRMNGRPYSQEDLEFIYSLGNLAITSLENARLFGETIEKEKLENELLLAKEIQQGLLPKYLPAISGFEIFAMNVSSKQVGGDYYDVIPLHDEKFIVAIGDVSGKGTPASLLMANVQATIRALSSFPLTLSDATARVNDSVYHNTAIDKFITFFWGTLDARSKNFRYVNAGHNPPFVLRADGTIERLTEGGIILGVMKATVPYQEGTVQLFSGDTVVLFTDGVSEAMNKEGEDYTEERLEQFLRTVASQSAKEILLSIHKEIVDYSEGAAQADDITLVVFKCV